MSDEVMIKIVIIKRETFEIPLDVVINKQSSIENAVLICKSGGNKQYMQREEFFDITLDDNSEHMETIRREYEISSGLSKRVVK